MFLDKLSDEKKEMFLQLSIHAAMSNDDFAEEQKVVIESYCEELGMKDYKIELHSDLKTLLEEIKASSSKKEKHIIVFEIASVILSDYNYDTIEQEFMNSLNEILEIPEETLEKMIELINNLMEVYEGIAEVILK